MAIGQKGGLLQAENSDVLNATLTGFVVGANTAITSSDTVLSAFEKTQGQINAITGGSSIFVKADGTIPLTATWNVGNHDITNINMLALGVTTATSVIDVSGNFSSTAWTTNGIGLRWRAATFTDTTSTGTVANAFIHYFAIPTVAASSSTTFTNIYTVYFERPSAGTNVTLGTRYAAGFGGDIFISGNTIQTGNINLGGATRTIGTTDSNILQFQTNGTVRAFFNAANSGLNIGTTAISSAPSLGINITSKGANAWTTTGIGIVQAAGTYTDNTSSGTVAAQYVNVIASPTIAASSVTTFTLSSTMFIAGPTAGTNVTQGTSAALILGGNMYFNIGTAAVLGTFDAQNLLIRTSNSTRITIGSGGGITFNTGITIGDALNFTFNATTGTKIGTATTEKLAFWNKTPIVQPTTAITGATRVGGAGTTVTTTDTYGGYTIAQLAAIIINTGLTA
jgi:hypothetical protein